MLNYWPSNHMILDKSRNICKLYQSYYPHQLRDSLSPVCVIFVQYMDNFSSPLLFRISVPTVILGLYASTPLLYHCYDRVICCIGSNYNLSILRKKSYHIYEPIRIPVFILYLLSLKQPGTFSIQNFQVHLSSSRECLKTIYTEN